MEEEIKNDLRESFKKISDDPYMLEIAEWGMDDYGTQLKKFDKWCRERYGKRPVVIVSGPSMNLWVTNYYCLPVNKCY